MAPECESASSHYGHLRNITCPKRQYDASARTFNSQESSLWNRSRLSKKSSPLKATKLRFGDEGLWTYPFRPLWSWPSMCLPGGSGDSLEVLEHQSQVAGVTVTLGQSHTSLNLPFFTHLMGANSNPEGGRGLGGWLGFCKTRGRQTTGGGLPSKWGRLSR